MVKQILTAAGFVENETFKATRFVTPPKVTYAVYFDAVRGRGADNLNLIAEHTVTIEVYSYAPDPEAEAEIEAEFDKIGQAYEKSDRYWINEEQLYQTVYTFYYVAKKNR